MNVKGALDQMAPLNEDQLEIIRNERKTQIMKAAIKVFAENGIKLTKIGMIAAEAGVSHGLLYHYFKSKEDVLYESLEWATEMNDVTDYIKQLHEMTLTPLQKINFFTKMALTEGNSDVFRVIQHLSKTDDVPDRIRIFMEQSSTLYVELFYPFFKEGQESGEIISGDTNELLELYLTVLSGIMADNLEWWQDNVEQKVNTLMRMIATH